MLLKLKMAVVAGKKIMIIQHHITTRRRISLDFVLKLGLFAYKSNKGTVLAKAAFDHAMNAQILARPVIGMFFRSGIGIGNT